MKAATQHRYGSLDALELNEIDTPVPADGEVLIRVRAAGMNPADLHLLRGDPYLMRLVGAGLGFGLRGPKHPVLGMELAGVVEAVGTGTQRLRPGDEVYGQVKGAFAEFACAPETSLAIKPATLNFEQAAVVPLAANTALQGLRDVGQLRLGQTVLINGASGGVGSFAVQIARSFGARVTGVCSTRNAEFVCSIGADDVIDYTQQDFTRAGRRFDVIFDLIGNHSLPDLRRALAPRGTLVLSSGTGGAWIGPVGRLARAVIGSAFMSRSMRPLAAAPNPENLVTLGELIDSGKVMPVIDRACPLKAVPDALRYLEQGHARGKIAITI